MMTRMMCTNAFASGLLLLGLSGCATPEYRAMLAAEKAAEAAMECRTEKGTGSNLPRKVCRSADAWAALDARQQREANEYSRQASEGSTIVGDSSGSTGFGTPTRVGL